MTQTAHQPLDLADVRRQLRLAIDAAKRAAVAHRQESDEAARAFEFMLEHVAAPLFRQFTSALRAEGMLFRVVTPSGSVRIEAERSADNYLELALDVARRPVAVVLRRAYTRGHHIYSDDRVLAEGADLSTVTPAAVALGADGRGDAVRRELGPEGSGDRRRPAVQACRRRRQPPRFDSLPADSRAVRGSTERRMPNADRRLLL